ncbi:MAG: hypothetical protein AB1736_11250 [Chloroflexota bacterium]
MRALRIGLDVRQLRISLAVAVLAGGVSLVGFANPDCAYACSCVEPQPIGTYVGQPDTLVLAGTVTAYDATTQRGVFRVERWYQGSSEVSDIPVMGGDGANCGIPLTVGQALVMVAFEADGFLQPNICSPWADLSTAEGQRLRDEAIEAFGEGTPPDDAATPDPGSPTGGGGEFAIPALVIYGGVAVIALIAIIAVASIVSARRGS